MSKEKKAQNERLVCLRGEHGKLDRKDSQTRKKEKKKEKEIERRAMLTILLCL